METEHEGVVSSGRAFTRFPPQGWADPTWIHIEGEAGEQYTIVVHPLMGRAEILDGRVER